MKGKTNLSDNLRKRLVETGSLALIDETLAYYDLPLLFTTHDESGQIYTAIALADDEEDGTRYLFVPISPDRLKALMEGSLTLRAAFQEAEGGWGLVATSPYRNLNQASVEQRQLSDLPDDWFSPPGVYL